ncbi:spaetzle-processing enzyme-like [Pectinophora gossypiella]|uniref:spaetzle-processing enzyme-like n=1 Tax=Pectinophora gossypiella TaxID=13191 RepID=UPI00214EC7C5|nr:spaetzle-processing enzyme-like [Pectinophora gossypiella]
MSKCSFLLCFVLIVAQQYGDVCGDRGDKCEKCIPKEKCSMYGEMSKSEQEKWIVDNPCATPDDEEGGAVYGFAPLAKGDYVCCPYSNIWGVSNPSKPNPQSDVKNDSIKSRYGVYEDDEQGYNQDNLHQTQNSHINRDDTDDSDDDNDDGEEVNYDKNRNRWNSGRNRWNNPGRFDYGNNMGAPRNQDFTNRPNAPLIQRPNGNQFNNNPIYNNPNGNYLNGGRQNFDNPNFRRPNSFVPNVQTPNVRQGMCSLTNFPPNPQSGCCGLDIAGDRMYGIQNNFNRPRPANQNRWNRQSGYPRRFTRDTPETVGITFDNRIAGGKETDLYQYPWTVLLKTTFDYGDRLGTFNCGGSLISGRYVLTAAHCVYEENTRISKLEIYLAEYDKRTFPRDCKSSPEGMTCIDNILVQGEGVVVHPNYDDMRLQNDIALVKLQENVPYTEYIRPICLPPINIDNPNFSNLRLAVAGWGRNGSLPSEVKQSTVVNLVPQRQCSNAYPQLTEKHLCAAGKTGEDTCKGDSGGPLMMLYEGRYYVSGVVSGKRADSRCGTSVPSLYTNVYHYVNWITQNIKN